MWLKLIFKDKVIGLLPYQNSQIRLLGAREKFLDQNSWKQAISYLAPNGQFSIKASYHNSNHAIGPKMSFLFLLTINMT